METMHNNIFEYDTNAEIHHVWSKTDAVSARLKLSFWWLDALVTKKEKPKKESPIIDWVSPWGKNGFQVLVKECHSEFSIARYVAPQ